MDETSQEIIEDFFNQFLNNQFYIWKNRNDLRSHISILLYKLRNTVFNISPQTERKMIPEIYNNNISALKVLLDNTKNNNVNVIIYIPPIRSDIKIPYNEIEYQNFKKQVKDFSYKYSHVKFYNFENIVPGKYFGMKNSTNFIDESEFDFMHFTSYGHEILYKELSKILNDI